VGHGYRQKLPVVGDLAQHEIHRQYPPYGGLVRNGGGLFHRVDFAGTMVDFSEFSQSEDRVWFKIVGIPRAKGSYTPIRTGTKIFLKSPKTTTDWEVLIRQFCAVRWEGEPLLGPIRADVIFYFPHTKASLKRGDKYVSKAPDGDKLQRAVYDAIQKLVIKNDAQICEWGGGKYYSETPGLKVILTKLV
jgi:Holliday junction resolvase RusA-like endonuclease